MTETITGATTCGGRSGRRHDAAARRAGSGSDRAARVEVTVARKRVLVDLFDRNCPRLAKKKR